MDYYISGGGGAPLDATPENGGYLHYVTVQVDGTVLTTQILQPGHLEVTYPDGENKIGPTQRVWVANTNFLPVTLNHLVLHLAAPPAGQTLGVTASIVYKNKAKSADAQIVSQSPGTVPGSVDVVVSANVKKARTTEITVAPVTLKALAKPSNSCYNRGRIPRRHSARVTLVACAAVSVYY